MQVPNLKPDPRAAHSCHSNTFRGVTVRPAQSPQFSRNAWWGAANTQAHYAGHYQSCIVLDSQLGRKEIAVKPKGDSKGQRGSRHFQEGEPIQH